MLAIDSISLTLEGASGLTFRALLDCPVDPGHGYGVMQRLAACAFFPARTSCPAQSI